MSDNFITRKEHYNNVTSMSEKIDDIKNEIGEMKIMLAGLPEKMFEKADQRYAGKPTEKIVYGMVGLILVIVLTSLVYLTINQQ